VSLESVARHGAQHFFEEISMMSKLRATVLFLLLAAVGASAQAPQIPLIPPRASTVKVVLFGHSWIYLMKGFQPWALPNIPSAHIAVKGFPGYTCAQLLPLVSINVPASTEAVFIMAATNDIAQKVPVGQHIACMQSMINELLGENSHMLIVLANVPPLCYSTVPILGDLRSSIAVYNQAYTAFPSQYPNNVVMVEMWTPLVDTNGWGLANMYLSDGAHFGPNGQDLVMGTIRDGLYAGLAQ
jgi:hypothetical protein